jgi:hypothetical protein
MLYRDLPIIRVIRDGLIAVIALGAAALPAGAWERPHGDAANLNFENVATAPAGSGSVSVPGLGTFAPGAGPVIAPDDTVYLGNREGEVIALHADGKPFWRRKITQGQSIVASPVIGANGTVYVVGVSYTTDHRVEPKVVTYDAALHRFTPSGGYIGATPFPTHDRGASVGAGPNILRDQGGEMIIVPATYGHKVGSTFDVRLIGFAPDGSVVADSIATTASPDLYGGSEDTPDICVVPLFWLPCIFGKFERAGSTLLSPPTGIGVFASVVVVSDHLHDLAGFKISNGAFTEIFRVHEDSLFMRSAPAILPDGHSIIGVEDLKQETHGDEPRGNGTGGIIFSGPNRSKVPAINGLGPIYATPTRLADGRVILLSGFGKMTVLENNVVATQIQIQGQSIVSPVASQSHVFLSMSDAFITLDASTLAQVSKVDWVGGGLSQPAIGPKGQVYAMASNILFVFPPPRKAPLGGATVTQPGTTVISTDPGTPLLEASQEYERPLTANGNRLFACEKLDGDDCGKGDYNTIALAFCQKMGFAEVSHLEVDSKKVKAETLDGQYCSKKKCKVFEEIDCANN